MDNIKKWPNMFLKSCVTNTARFLKYDWSFFNGIKEKIKLISDSGYSNKTWQKKTFCAENHKHIENLQQIHNCRIS